jgi:N-methylhydantoinase A
VLASAPGVRAGIDVGGTFTDVVAWGAMGRPYATKVPTTPSQPAQGVAHGLAIVAARGGRLASLAHGTTVVTNAIVEGRGARVGLITTRGFRDVLEIARQNRAHLYRLDLPARPEPLVPRRLRAEISERIGADGGVLVPLALDELPRIVESFRREGVESVAVCLLHAYANAQHERALGAALAPHFALVSISSDVNAELREYERTVTTALNARVMPLATRYLDDLQAALAVRHAGMPVHLLHSAGGMMSLSTARVRPLLMAMSGPAAGVAGCAWLARRLHLDRAVAFDMGGTTTDVCLVVDGTAETTAQRRLGGVPVRLPAVAVESIGAGGGSVAFVDGAGALKVGPRSAAAQPGPAAYGQGGTEPTVTDANLVLGYLNPERIYGGSIRLDRGGAEAAFAPLCRALGLSLIEAAHGVVEVANASMLRALRLVSVQRGHDLRACALVAYGGAGPIHAGALARMAAMRTVVVPALSGAFSALGCLVSPLRYDAVQTHRARLEAWDPTPLEDRFGDLEARCLAPFRDEGVPLESVTLYRSIELRYVGQNYELEVPFDRDATRLRGAFERRHRQLYGYATGENVEGVTLRVMASLPGPAMTLPTLAGEAGDGGPVGAQRAYFPATGEMRLPRYDRGRLPAGLVVVGPALVEDESSTVLVYPGQGCRADRFGNLLIEEYP